MTITDKLNEEWEEYKLTENMFAIRAQIEELKNNIDQFFLNVEENYPTGDTQFDAYVEPIKDSVIDFRNLLAAYYEFILWRQPG